MSVNVLDYMTKFQEEGLKALKQTQDASLKAMQNFSEFGKEFGKELNDKPGTFPAFENVPSPTQFVEMSFGFASQVLEMRKAFTMQIAEMITDAQKQAKSQFDSAKAQYDAAPVSKPAGK